jgi:hypothetical protein
LAVRVGPSALTLTKLSVSLKRLICVKNGAAKTQAKAHTLKV